MKQGTMVSVVIPVYNVEQYLRDCLDSVCGQTLDELEIICVDDGSTDGSPDILAEFQVRDSRVRVLRQENQGQSVARNLGLEEANGQYIYFCDSDDYMEPDALRLALTAAERDGLEMVFFNISVLDNGVDSQRAADEVRYFTRTGTYPGVMRGSEFFYQLRKRDEYICTVYQYLLRRDFLLQTGVRFYPGIIHQDELFTLQVLFRAERVGFLPQKLYCRRLWSGSVILTTVGAEDVRGTLLAAVAGIPSFTQPCRAEEQEALIDYLVSFLRIGRNRYRSLTAEAKEDVLNWTLPEQLYFRLIMQGEVLQPELERLEEACAEFAGVAHGPSSGGLLVYGVGAHLYDVLDEHPELGGRIGRIFDNDKEKIGTFLVGPNRIVEPPQKLVGVPEGTRVYISAIRYFDAISRDIMNINPGLVCVSLDDLCQA